MAMNHHFICEKDLTSSRICNILPITSNMLHKMEENRNAMEG